MANPSAPAAALGFASRRWLFLRRERSGRLVGRPRLDLETSVDLPDHGRFQQFPMSRSGYITGPHRNGRQSCRLVGRTPDTAESPFDRLRRIHTCTPPCTPSKTVYGLWF